MKDTSLTLYLMKDIILTTTKNVIIQHKILTAFKRLCNNRIELFIFNFIKNVQTMQKALIIELKNPFKDLSTIPNIA